MIYFSGDLKSDYLYYYEKQSNNKKDIWYLDSICKSDFVDCGFGCKIKNI